MRMRQHATTREYARIYAMRMTNAWQNLAHGHPYTLPKKGKGDLNSTDTKKAQNNWHQKIRDKTAQMTNKTMENL